MSRSVPNSIQFKICLLMIIICSFVGCTALKSDLGSRASVSLAPTNESFLAKADPQSGRLSRSRSSKLSDAGELPGVKPRPGSNRKIIYTADMQLRVPNVDQTRIQIEKLADELGGFVQSSSLTRVSFRVAPEQFNAALEKIAEMGEITRRDIKTEDVTMQFVDLQSRIETAEKSRQRLMKLLEDVTLTKDVIQVERDIRRLTEELEVIKGRMRVLSDQIDLSTINISLVRKVQEQRHARRNKFEPAWMKSIGIDRLLGTRSDQWIEGPLLPRRFKLGLKSGNPLPDSFLKMRDQRYELVGSSPDDYRLRMKTLRLNQDAKLSLWTNTLHKNLSESRGYDAKPAETIEFSNSKFEGAVIKTSTIYSGETWSYDIYIVRRKSNTEKTLIIEWARLKKDQDIYKEELQKAIFDLKFNWLF